MEAQRLFQVPVIGSPCTCLKDMGKPLSQPEVGEAVQEGPAEHRKDGSCR